MPCMANSWNMHELGMVWGIYTNAVTSVQYCLVSVSYNSIIDVTTPQTNASQGKFPSM